MTLFRNKHIVVAMLVTPVLAVIAWVGTDWLVGERPTAAQADRSYPLRVMPNCRYASGLCTLRNGDVQIDLALRNTGNGVDIVLDSHHPLSGVKLAMVTSGLSEGREVVLQSASDQQRWTGATELSVAALSGVRLAVGIGQSFYYAETGVDFAKGE